MPSPLYLTTPLTTVPRQHAFSTVPVAVYPEYLESRNKECGTEFDVALRNPGSRYWPAWQSCSQRKVHNHRGHPVQREIHARTCRTLTGTGDTSDVGRNACHAGSFAHEVLFDVL